MDGQTTWIKKWANFPKSFLGSQSHWMAADKVFNNVNSAGSAMQGAPNIIKRVNNLVVFLRTYSPYIPPGTWSQLLETNNSLVLCTKVIVPQATSLTVSFSNLADYKSYPGGLPGISPAASFFSLGMTANNQASWIFMEKGNAYSLVIFWSVIFVKSIHTWVKLTRLPDRMGRTGRALRNHQAAPSILHFGNWRL